MRCRPGSMTTWSRRRLRSSSSMRARCSPQCAARIDDAERKLIEQADALAVAALAQVEASATDAGALAGLVEKHARIAGAEEAYIAIAPDLDLDRRPASRSRARCRWRAVSRCAPRSPTRAPGYDVRRASRAIRKARSAMASADAWLPQAMHALRDLLPSRGYSTVAASFALLRAGQHSQMTGWMAESCIASYPLEVVASLPVRGKEGPAPGTFLVLSVELAIDDVPWLGAAPMFVQLLILHRRRMNRTPTAGSSDLVLVVGDAVADVVVEQVVAGDADHDLAQAVGVQPCGLPACS